jgi:hypothetical protein
MQRATTVYAAPAGGLMRPVAWPGNAWGLGPRVWTALAGRYLGERMAWLRPDDARRLRGMVLHPGLCPTERLVLAATIEGALVRQPEFVTLAAELEAFAALHPAGKSTCHLGVIAELLRGLASDHELNFEPWAVGFDCGQGAGSPWYVPQPSAMPRPYDLGIDLAHSWIFDLVHPPVAAGG